MGDTGPVGGEGKVHWKESHRYEWEGVGWTSRAADGKAGAYYAGDSKDCGRSNDEMRLMRLVVSASFYWDFSPG